MAIKAKFYHAGCPVCVSAEQALATGLDTSKYEVEIVHLGEEVSRIDEAAAAGVETVPALVIGGEPYHINFGAKLSDLR